MKIKWESVALMWLKEISRTMPEGDFSAFEKPVFLMLEQPKFYVKRYMGEIDNLRADFPDLDIMSSLKSNGVTPEGNNSILAIAFDQECRLAYADNIMMMTISGYLEYDDIYRPISVGVFSFSPP